MLIASNAFGAVIRGTALGIADTTPDFWSIEYIANTGTKSVTEVELTLPNPGSFDFDGVGNYGNHTDPAFSNASTGISASDISFVFGGVHPPSLLIVFAPGSFGPGDEVRFAAGIDGFGSQLGGAVGAFGGTQLRVVLDGGSTGSAQIVTDTSVSSTGSVAIAGTAIPEPSFGNCSILAAFAIAACSGRLRKGAPRGGY
jgi:hypothetical protein